jgi:predicted transcriptional regulator
MGTQYVASTGNRRQGFLLYLPPDLHRRLKRLAEDENVSMTLIATEAIERELELASKEGSNA